MVEPDVLTTESWHATWPRSMTARSFSVPVYYNFDSDEEEDVYPEEVSEVVLPLCARFDSLTREEAGRYITTVKGSVYCYKIIIFMLCVC